MRYLKKQWLCGIVLGFVFLSFRPVSADHVNPSSRQQTLVVGTISSNPQKAVKRTQVFADYVASQLSSLGIKEAQVVVAKDIEQMTSWLKSGEVDLVSETVFAASVMIDKANVKLIARRWKSGVGEYSSVFFTSKKSGIKSFSDLVGKTIVFEDRGSSSSFLVPASLLLSQGYRLQELSSPREKPQAGKIGYFFSDDFSNSGGEKNMMAWVHRGLVASAAFSDIDWHKEIPEAVKKDMMIFHQSQSMPRSLMLVSSKMSVQKRQKLSQALFDADQNEPGKTALHRYKKTLKFDPITDDINAAVLRAKEQKQLIESTLSR